MAKRLISAILRYNYGMNPLGSLSSAKKRGHVSKIESLPGLSSRANLRRRTTRCRPREEALLQWHRQQKRSQRRRSVAKYEQREEAARVEKEEREARDREMVRELFRR